MPFLRSHTVACSMMANFELDKLAPPIRHDLACQFLMLKEIFTQMIIQPGHPQHAALVTFLSEVCSTVQALCLDWSVPEKKKKTLETDFPAISKIWQFEDNPVMFYNDIRKALDFIHAHPKCFNEALWSWARQFLDAVKQDMEDANLSVLTFDTGSIIF